MPQGVIPGRAQSGMRKRKGVSLKVNQDGEFYHAEIGNESFYQIAERRAGHYRSGVMAHCIKLAREYGAASVAAQMRNRVVIDVGANVGEFSHFALDHEAKVYAVEPDPLAFAALKKNMKGCGVKCHRLALWKENTTVPLTLISETGDSTVLPVGADTTIPVKAVTLKRFMDVLKLDDVFLLKADCEGAEPEMLEGAGDALRRISYITIDCGPERYKHTTVDACAKILTEQGFEVNQLKQKRVILFCRQNGDII